MKLYGTLIKINNSNIYPYEIKIDGSNENHLVKSIDINTINNKPLKEIKINDKISIEVKILDKKNNNIFVRCLSGVGFWI
jgi:hypothetical protein